MLDSYEDLVSNIGILSNRFRKYLEIVRLHVPALRARLDEQGISGKVHLWRKSPNYAREMQLVMQAARSEDELRTFLGTYYALQILHLHFLNIDRLRRDASNYKSRLKIYRQILTKLRIHLKNLVSNYLAALVEVSTGSRPMDGIVICNVGMIIDQDDLDVGVIINSETDQVFWNRTISQVSREYLKYSTKMHFYLAERVAKSSFLTTLQDFQDYLNQGANNFVLASELLLTEPLIGDETLIQRFEREIIDQFYYARGNLRIHEGYLRGMMGEVQDLSRFDLDSPWISPKAHALRLIHNLVNMLKTIHGIREHGSRHTLEILIDKDPENSIIYSGLLEIFNFAELFFYVYQLIVSTDDVIDSTESVDMENLDLVATVMGLPKLGIVRPAMRLMALYYENLNNLSTLTEKLMDKIKRHLKSVCVFNSILKNQPPDDFAVAWTQNTALNMLVVFKVFHDVRYWDDVLELMDDQNGSNLTSFIDALLLLKEPYQLRTFRQILRLLIFDMDSMIKTVILFSQLPAKQHFQRLFDFLKEWFTAELTGKEVWLKSFIALFRTHPSDLALCLLSLESNQLLRIQRASAMLSADSEENSDAVSFLKLCQILVYSSNNYRRLFRRVVVERPCLITEINDPKYLEGVSMQMYAELADCRNPQDLKRRLTTFYEFSFCRCGMIVFHRPTSPRQLYDDYNSFFRRYFRWLFRSCQWDIENASIFPFHFREMDEDDQPMAIFCAGGYAREEAFENDIDLFIITRDTDPKFIQYAQKITNYMNKELINETIMPQYRFADFIGSYIMTVEELDQLLSDNGSSHFIELSQLLGSKLLIGGQKLDSEVLKLLQKHIFNKPRTYIMEILNEIHDRESCQSETDDRIINVREDSGALRDIQLIVGACQAFTGRKEPVIWKSLESLAVALPDLRSDFEVLGQCYRFLRIFKDVHVLFISDMESITFEHLIDFYDSAVNEPEPIDSERRSKEKLIEHYHQYRTMTKTAIQNIEQYLRKELQ